MSGRGARVRIEGRSLERVLSAAVSEGITLCCVRRISLKEIEASLSNRKLARLEQICAKQGATVVRIRLTGTAAALALLRRRITLPIAAVVCACLIGLVGSRIWEVRVDADTGVASRLEEALDEWGISPGVSAASIDTDEIETLALTSFPELRFVSARLRGVTFTLSARESEPPPDTYELTPADMSAANVLARCDATVCEINALCGTALVKPGDLVRKGDVLIEGVEKTGVDTYRPVQALGSVTGYIWYTGRAEAALKETIRTRTGALDYHREICLPGLDGGEWLSYVLREGRGFVNCDTWTEHTPLGGLFVPLQLRTQWYAEVSVETAERPMIEAETEAERLAYAKARARCPLNADVIDKWTDYSIIDMEYVQAVVTLQTVQSIIANGAESPG